jgi:hypothetical protein
MNHCISTDSLTDGTMEQEFEVIMDETNGNILIDCRLNSCDCGCIVVFD